MQYLKANDAATVLIGPFVAPADGVTPVTDITLGAADHAELMKHDGTAFVDLTGDSRAFTHKEGGWYTLALGAGDIDTEGRLTVVIMDTDACLPVWKDFMVLAEAAYDSMFAAKDTGYMDVDVKAVGGTATPHTSGKLHVLNGDGAAIVAAGPTKIEMDNGHGLLATEAKQDIIDTNVDDIEADTNELQGLIASSKIAAQVKGIDDIDLSATMKASVESECGDAINDTVLDAVPVANSIADILRSKILAKLPQSTYLKGSADADGGIDTVDKADLQQECADALTAYGLATKTEMDNGHGLLATEAKQDIIDTVVDGIQTDLSNATDGLGALKDLIDALQTDLDNPGQFMADLSTLETRLSAARAGYIDNLSAGAAALEATLTTLKQKVAGAFNRETDSLEAIRDRGDAAWITGGGGAAPTVEEIDAQLTAEHGEGGWVTGEGGGGVGGYAVFDTWSEEEKMAALRKLDDIVTALKKKLDAAAYEQGLSIMVSGLSGLLKAVKVRGSLSEKAIGSRISKLTDHLDGLDKFSRASANKDDIAELREALDSLLNRDDGREKLELKIQGLVGKLEELREAVKTDFEEAITPLLPDETLERMAEDDE